MLNPKHCFDSSVHLDSDVKAVILQIKHWKFITGPKQQDCCNSEVHKLNNTGKSNDNRRTAFNSSVSFNQQAINYVQC